MLTTISLFFICSGFVIALIIANDLVQNKQSMKIMNVVWVLTALWAKVISLSGLTLSSGWRLHQRRTVRIWTWGLI